MPNWLNKNRFANEARGIKIKVNSRPKARKAAILTTELLLIMAILIGGLTAILNKLRDSVNTEFQNASQELHNVIGGQLKTLKSTVSTATGQAETIENPARVSFNPPTP